MHVVPGAHAFAVVLVRALEHRHAERAEEVGGTPRSPEREVCQAKAAEVTSPPLRDQPASAERGEEPPIEDVPLGLRVRRVEAA